MAAIWHVFQHCSDSKKLVNIEAILKKLSVGGNISDKKVNRKEGNFYFFKEHFQIFCEMWFLQIFDFQKENMK